MSAASEGLRTAVLQPDRVGSADSPGTATTLRLLPGGRAPEPPPVGLHPIAPEPDVDVDELVDVDVDADVDADADGAGLEEPEVRRLDQLPDPRPLAGQLAQAVVEVLSGDRPITQLLTWLDERIYLELSVLAPDPPTTPAVGRRARAVVIRPQDRPRVRSVHVCRPADGVAEVAVRVQTNGRSRAVAMRLEEWRGRWRCSALVVG